MVSLFPKSQRIVSAPTPVYVKVRGSSKQTLVDGETENKDVGVTPFPTVITLLKFVVAVHPSLDTEVIEMPYAPEA